MTLCERSGSASASLMLRIHAGPGCAPGRISTATSCRRLRLGEFLFEALGLVMTHQAVHQGSELAVHDFGQLMDGQADAVVGDAVLRVIIRPNFFGAVTSFDLATPLGGNGSLLLFELHFVKTRAEHAHGLRAVLDL